MHESGNFCNSNRAQIKRRSNSITTRNQKKSYIFNNIIPI